jgi:hypothetical protein
MKGRNMLIINLAKFALIKTVIGRYKNDKRSIDTYNIVGYPCFCMGSIYVNR